MSQQWYVRRGNQDKQGPFSSEQLRGSASQGALTPGDLVWREGMADWVPASRVKGLFTAPPGTPVEPTSPPPAPSARSSGGSTPPPPVDAHRQVIDRHLAELFSTIMPSLEAGSSSLIPGGRIPPKKLEGVRQYCSHASEGTIRLLFDSTMFGTASEGFVMLHDGIAWRNSGSSKPGWKRFEELDTQLVGSEIQSGVLGTKYLVLGRDDSDRIKCGSIDAAILGRLTTLLVTAARVAQGVEPKLLRAKARLAAGASDHEAASALWMKAAEDPDAIAHDIIEDVRAAIQKYGSPAPLDKLLATLMSRCDTRADRWSLRRANQRFPEFVSATALAERWSNGELFQDDLVRHFGETEWYSVADCEPVASLPRVFFRDTGPYDAKVYGSVVTAARASLGGAAPLFVGPFASDGAHGIHLCVSDTELLRIRLPEGGAPVVERLPIAHASLKVEGGGQQGGGAAVEVRFGADCHVGRIPAGPGLEALRGVWKRVAVESAKRSLALDRLYEAQQTLADVFRADDKDEVWGAVRDACRPVVEAVVDYQGGHPRLTDHPVRGVLRLDEKGLEFNPSTRSASGYLRIPYSDIAEVAPPAIGEVPEEIRANHAKKQATGAALSIAATFLVGGQTGRSVGRSMRPDQSAVKPPKNRLGVSMRSDGTTYKLFFDVVDSDRDVMEKSAKDFWASAATVRGRFGKQAGVVRARGQASGAAATAEAGGSDVRELLLTLLELQLTGDVAKELVDSGDFTEQQLVERRRHAVSKLARVLSGARLQQAGVVGVGSRSGDGISGVPLPLPEAGSPPTTPGQRVDLPSRMMSSGTAAAIGVGVGVLAAGAASVALGGGHSQGAGGSPGSEDAVLLDLDHDGRADAVGMDTDGDGRIDTVGVDRDGDGDIDAIAVDNDGDGQVDAVGVDSDGDGDIDAVAVDSDHDGQADGIVMDTDNDGIADVAAIDGDDDGDIDAIAMDHDADGSIDEIVVDEEEDEHALAMDDEDEQFEEPDDDFDEDGDFDA